MIRAYSQRLLPPYSGVVQIAESERARAQSFDGVSWEIQYFAASAQADKQSTREKGYALDRSFFRVAKLENHQLSPYILPACLDSAEVADSISELSEFLTAAEVPFAAADIFEYWLLDAADESPLALMFSCCEEAQMSTYPRQAAWTALPHSKMKIDNSSDEQARGAAPVNHRFQALVADRAGNKPRAAWFERNDGDTEMFPRLLVCEDWHSEADFELCQRYLQRKAPRLLLLQGLLAEDRQRMEIAAKKYPFEVEQYYPLYPQIHDQRLMSAIRVEARLRRNAPQQPKAPDKPSSTEDKRLSKDMRIFET